MVKKQSLADAKIDIKRMGFDKNKSFFELTQKEKDMLQSILDVTKYTKPKSATGSKLRAFWESVSK